MNCFYTGPLERGDCFTRVTTFNEKDGFERVELETLQGKKFFSTFNSEYVRIESQVSALNYSNSGIQTCIIGAFGYSQTDFANRPVTLGFEWANFTRYTDVSTCNKTKTTIGEMAFSKSYNMIQSLRPDIIQSLAT